MRPGVPRGHHASPPRECLRSTGRFFWKGRAFPQGRVNFPFARRADGRLVPKAFFRTPICRIASRRGDGKKRARSCLQKAPLEREEIRKPRNASRIRLARRTATPGERIRFADRLPVTLESPCSVLLTRRPSRREGGSPFFWALNSLSMEPAPSPRNSVCRCKTNPGVRKTRTCDSPCDNCCCQSDAEAKAMATKKQPNCHAHLW